MDRRRFITRLGAAALGLPLSPRLAVPLSPRPGSWRGSWPAPWPPREGRAVEPMTLFLAGDVMTGRGVDQILPHPVDPTLHEPYVKTARRYLALAEQESGEIDVPVGWEYVWGDALDELDRVGPDHRIINLETSITTSDDWWRTKGIHYRMHPRNAPVLAAAGVDACVLGNNHVLDWGREGLLETLATLESLGIAAAGAGRDAASARSPAVLGSRSGQAGGPGETGAGRLLLFAVGTPSAGVPASWAAGPDEAGVHVLRRLDARAADGLIEEVESVREAGDRVVVSIHWGGNWGYEIPDEQRAFAHRLIDAGAADVVFGHSSHHPKGIEVYRGRPILYGAGDFLNDYEGIGGRDEYRGDLTLMYFPELATDGTLRRLRMTPMRIRRLQLQRTTPGDTRWLAERMDRECRKLGSRVVPAEEGRLELAL